MEDNKPCPFCGGVASGCNIWTGADYSHHRVMCANCQANVTAFHKEKAWEKWNTRDVGAPSTRYFLGQDGSGHWYLVPVEHQDEWNDWRDLPEDDEAAWQEPAWAKRLNGGPSITFCDPSED